MWRRVEKIKISRVRDASERLLTENIVLTAPKIMLKDLVRMHPQLILAKDSFNFRMYSFPVRKDSPYKAAFDNA